MGCNIPKRFTDTEKWKDEWFLELTKDEKMVWIYLCDNCTNAGRWKKSLKHLNFCCDTAYTEDDLKKIFGDRIIDCETFFFLPKFLKFQYPRGINVEKPAIKAVRKELEEYDLEAIVRQLLGNHYLMIKDMDMDKDMDKDKDNSNTSNIYKTLFLDFVYLKAEEYQKLIDKLGRGRTEEYIEKLNNYIGSKGKRYKSHYHTILNWTGKDKVPKSEDDEIILKFREAKERENVTTKN